MKYDYLIIGLTAILISACSIQVEEAETQSPEDEVFYAAFEQPTEKGTKVYANTDLLLRWNADDRVSIFNNNTYNQEYQFIGETGDNARGFNKVNSAEFVTGTPTSNVISVYPYQSSTQLLENGLLSLTLPAEQVYAEESFGLGANIMVAISSDNFLHYKNVGGYLRLSLPEGSFLFRCIAVSSINTTGDSVFP